MGGLSSRVPWSAPNHLQRGASVRNQFFRGFPRSLENHSSEGQTVVRHFKPSRTIRLHVRKTVHKPISSANTDFNACASRVASSSTFHFHLTSGRMAVSLTQLNLLLSYNC